MRHWVIQGFLSGQNGKLHGDKRGDMSVMHDGKKIERRLKDWKCVGGQRKAASLSHVPSEEWEFTRESRRELWHL
jgi:hypothetical protein